DTRHTTHDTRHTTHDTRHTTHDTRHTTHDTRHTNRDQFLDLWLWLEDDSIVGVEGRARVSRLTHVVSLLFLKWRTPMCEKRFSVRLWQCFMSGLMLVALCRSVDAAAWWSRCQAPGMACAAGPTAWCPAPNTCTPTATTGGTCLWSPLPYGCFAGGSCAGTCDDPAVTPCTVAGPATSCN
ncbi:MAG: hypothetical protein NTX48_20425, partial [Planctomycetales bacterium]|nr:hypothetical protein [Planctomycetales bacterium]